MKVHLSYAPQPDDLAYLESLLEERISLTVGEIDQADPETSILIAGRPSREELEYLPALETLIVPWIGIPPETLDLVRDYPGLALHNLHHNAPPAAELALALLLAAAKEIVPFDQALRAGDWTPRYQKPSRTILLAGKRGLVLGYGEIGKRVGEALQGLGVKVDFIRREPGENDGPQVYPLSALPGLLPGADFLVVALPLTEETRGLIGEEELRALPPTAVVVNVARGKIIDEAALFQALSEKWIFGAGLDVWFNYPGSEQERASTLPGDFPWGSLDNLVLSPHRAGHVRETEQLRMAALAELLNQAARGEKIANPVDLDLGY